MNHLVARAAGAPLSVALIGALPAAAYAHERGAAKCLIDGKNGHQGSCRGLRWLNAN